MCFPNCLRQKINPATEIEAAIRPRCTPNGQDVCGLHKLSSRSAGVPPAPTAETAAPHFVAALPRYGLALSLIFFLLLTPIAARAQRRRGMGRIRAAAAQKSPAWRQRRIQQDQHRHAPNFFRRLRDLPPDQQDRILQNDARFHSLPPQRQAQIRQNLRRWNSLTPHQKQVLRQREEIVKSLSPEQRQDLRNIFPQYRRLPAQQQQQVMRAFRRLRNMPPGERQRFLNSPQFNQRFTPEQQNVLRGLNQLLPK